MNRTNKRKQIEEWLNDSSSSEYDDPDNDPDFDIDNKTSEDDMDVDQANLGDILDQNANTFLANNFFDGCNDDSSTYMQPSVDLLSPSQSSTPDFSSVDEQDEEQDLAESVVTAVEWRNVTGNLKNLIFTASSGVSNYCIEQLDDYQPINFYNLFVDDEIMHYLVNETNKYALQCTISGIVNESISDYSRLNDWTDVNLSEMKCFIGFIIWMGLDKKPSLNDYWSKKLLYKNFVSKYMSKNRFRAILSMFHFSDNENSSNVDRLYKINPFLDMMNNKFHKMYEPDESVCIDETMVPFRGRLHFRQYIPGKRHKYGIKLFILCMKGGYTWNIKIYGGKEKEPGKQVATSVVLELMKPILGTGRTLYTDNYYTSVDLAHKLLVKNTHLVGTLRRNRKNNPKPVLNSILKKNEIKAMESNTGVIVAKWKDKRDVLFLSTKHEPMMVDVNTKHGLKISKPIAIIDYNEAKSYIDVSDQKASYASTIRKGIKWYRKVGIELLTNTAIVNAHLLFQKVTKNKINISEFREKIVMSLIKEKIQDKNEPIDNLPHKLQQHEKRGRCSRCYLMFSKQFGWSYAVKHAKQVQQKCPGCENKFFCNDCFFSLHKTSLKSNP